jgi:hypothetical protein
MENGESTARDERFESDERDRLFPGWWTYAQHSPPSAAPVYRVVCTTYKDYVLARRVKPQAVRATIKYEPQAVSVERTVEETHRQRQLLAALIDDDWLGFSVLASVGTPSLATEIATMIGADVDRVATVLALLVGYGAVVVDGPRFARSMLGEGVIRAVESSVGISLRSLE